MGPLSLWLIYHRAVNWYFSLFSSRHAPKVNIKFHGVHDLLYLECRWKGSGDYRACIFLDCVSEKRSSPNRKQISRHQMVFNKSSRLWTKFDGALCAMIIFARWLTYVLSDTFCSTIIFLFGPAELWMRNFHLKWIMRNLYGPRFPPPKRQINDLNFFTFSMNF